MSDIHTSARIWLGVGLTLVLLMRLHSMQFQTIF